MFIIFKKRTLIFALVLIVLLITGAVLIFAGVVNSATGVFTLSTNKKLPVYCVDSADKVVALTFDAAWGADKTEGIINCLNEYDAKATFFLVGFWINKYPEMVKKIDKSGMLIGNHSNNHLHMSRLNEDLIMKEVDTVNKSLKDITKKDVHFFRAPFGDYNNRLIETLNKQSMMCIQWDVDSLDWKGISANEIKDRVMKKVKSGSIILFHNNSDNILEALPKVMLALKNEGYKFITLDKLVYKDNYYIDNNGIQHSKL